MIRPEESLCCGCSACADICPRNCIRLKPIGKLGALLPEVDTEKCIHCNRCLSVCPYQNEAEGQKDQECAYSARSKSREVLKQSSSGGMFFTFASELISQGYTVFGAAFDENLKLHSCRADTVESLKKLCKSKYLQSDAGGLYNEIDMLLRQGKKVFFAGTPCQCKALRLRFGNRSDHLLTVDFFCHGVPSQEFFDQCRAVYEKDHQCRVLSYEFRTKVNGGVTPHYFTLKTVSDRGERVRSDFYFKSPFYAAFQSYINLRESCYNCRFASRKRYSDITIGDFHGIGKYDPDVNRFDGISMVILNTEKGKALWEQCAPLLDAKPMDPEQLIRDGQCFGGGTQRPQERDAFIRDYARMPFGKLLKKWFPARKYLKQKIYYRLPDGIRKILKKAGLA